MIIRPSGSSCAGDNDPIQDFSYAKDSDPGLATLFLTGLRIRDIDEDLIRILTKKKSGRKPDPF